MMADRRGLLSPIDVQGLLAARSAGLLGSMPTGEMRGHVPSLRDRIGNMVFDAATAAGLRQSAQRMRQDAGVAMDFVPGIGDAVGAEEAGRAFGAGRYGDAALGASLAAVGAMPVVGDAVAGAAKKGIRAFHGSPHSFDKFDLGKIGTGEGAQAYGHGLYFAEAEDVARDYRDKLTMSPKVHIFDGAGNDISGTDAGITREIEDLAMARGKSMEQAVDAATGWRRAVAGGDVSMLPDEAREVLEKRGVHAKHAGSMYEVNINADPDDFLDWDKPLSEQPSRVRGALSELGVNAPRQLDDARNEDEFRAFVRPLTQAFEGTKYAGLFSNRSTVQGILDAGPEANAALIAELRKEAPAGADALGAMLRRANEPTGEGIYRTLATSPYDSGSTAGFLKAPGSEAMSASERLSQAGIPGLKYLDRGSRAAGDGSRNFVVFDDKLIEIVRKYGLAAALGAGLITQEMAAQMQAQGLGT